MLDGREKLSGLQCVIVDDATSGESLESLKERELLLSRFALTTKKRELFLGTLEFAPSLVYLLGATVWVSSWQGRVLLPGKSKA